MVRSFLMRRQEIFGPVLTVVKAKDLDDALALINRNRCTSLLVLISSYFDRLPDSIL